MTSARLSQTLSGIRDIGSGRKVEISPDEVYAGATLAQNELMSELPLVTGQTSVVLTSGRTLYQYPAIAITVVTAVSGVMNVTLPGHVFQTGDKVVVQGVVNRVFVNLNYTCTRVSSTVISLDGSSVSDNIAVGHIVYHAINQARLIPDKGIKIPDYAPLDKHTQAEFDRLRAIVTDTGTPLYFREYQTDPISFSIVGTADVTATIDFIRKPLPTEEINESINPIIPSIYDASLIKGTLTLIFETFKSFPDVAEGHRTGFERQKKNIKEILGRQQQTPVILDRVW